MENISEVMKQEQFRTNVLSELAKEGTMLKDLDNRVKELERTVTQGNGHPALTVQVKELETKMDNISNEVSSLRDDISKIDIMNERLIKISTRLDLQDKGNGRWFQSVIIIITIITTAIVDMIFLK
jgi:uncharacterized coiled-coil DUF342 family protein